MKPPRLSFWFTGALLAAAVSGLWARSYRRCDNIVLFTYRGAVQAFASLDGRTRWVISTVTVGRAHAWSCDYFTEDAVACQWQAGPSQSSGEALLNFDPVERELIGFGYQLHRTPSSAPSSAVVLHVPHWFWLALATIPMLRRAWQWQRTVRWNHEGRCSACGYDLRATPDRCPECGAEPAASAA